MKNEGLKPLMVPFQELPEVDLNAAEIYWIKFFRESGLRLTNGTNGGEGATPGSHYISLEGRQRIALAQKKLRSKPVLETTTGKVFSSGREAEKALNLSNGTVSKVLLGKWAQASGYHFQNYKGDTNEC